jgi:hypothetical protein
LENYSYKSRKEEERRGEKIKERKEESKLD